jgi:hypothetical protein
MAIDRRRLSTSSGHMLEGSRSPVPSWGERSRLPLLRCQYPVDGVRVTRAIVRGPCRRCESTSPE